MSVAILDDGHSLRNPYAFLRIQKSVTNSNNRLPYVSYASYAFCLAHARTCRKCIRKRVRCVRVAWLLLFKRKSCVRMRKNT